MSYLKSLRSTSCRYFFFADGMNSRFLLRIGADKSVYQETL